MAGIPGGYESSSSVSDDELFYTDSHSRSRKTASNGSTAKTVHVHNGGNIQEAQPHRQTMQAGRPLEDLRMAVMKGDIDTVKDFLKTSKVSIDTILTAGWTALMYAASCGWPDIIELLLENGANANFHNNLYTPLMACCAARRDRIEDLIRCATLLIKHGANVNAKDRHLMTPLMYAARDGKLEIVLSLLEAGAELNSQDGSGWTALCWSAHHGQGRVVRILLEKGASIDSLTIKGETASDIAKAANMRDLAEMIDSKGATGSKNDVSLKKPEIPKKFKHDVEAAKQAGMPRQVSRPYIKSLDDLALFLNGLKLSELIPIFQAEGVTMPDLLRMDESDLEKIGVQQYAYRKRILDNVRVVHTAPWQKASVLQLGKGKVLGCPDIIAVLGNISEHQRHTWTTLRWIHETLRRKLKMATEKKKDNQMDANDDGSSEGTIFEVGQDVADVNKLRMEVESTTKEVESLLEELRELKQFTDVVSRYPEFSSVEFGSSLRGANKEPMNWKRRVVLVGAFTMCCLLLVKAHRTIIVF